MINYRRSSGIESNVKWFRRVVFGIIGLSLFLLLAWYALVGFAAFKVMVSNDFSGGIKPVIEKVWCGEAGCFDKK